MNFFLHIFSKPPFTLSNDVCKFFIPYLNYFFDLLTSIATCLITSATITNKMQWPFAFSCWTIWPFYQALCSAMIFGFIYTYIQYFCIIEFNWKTTLTLMSTTDLFVPLLSRSFLHRFLEWEVCTHYALSNWHIIHLTGKQHWF